MSIYPRVIDLPDGQDWSADHSDAALITHVRARMQGYLSPATVQRVQNEFRQLRQLFG